MSDVVDLPKFTCIVVNFNECKMTQKQYEKDFENRFGVKPFTTNEMIELKAMLFNVGANNDGQANLYCRYHGWAEVKKQLDSRARYKEEKDNKYYDELASYAI